MNTFSNDPATRDDDSDGEKPTTTNSINSNSVEENENPTPRTRFQCQRKHKIITVAVVLLAIGIGTYFFLDYALYNNLKPQVAGEYCRSDDKCQSGDCDLEREVCRCTGNKYWAYSQIGCKTTEMCQMVDGIFSQCIPQPACPPNITMEVDDAKHQILPATSGSDSSGFVSMRSWNYFGSSVAIDGDRAIVGAPYIEGYPCLEGGDSATTQTRSSLSTGKGFAYIFVRKGSEWVQEAELTPAEGDYGWEGTGGFGVSVALDNNVAIVGSHNACGGTQGSAYVFVRNDETSEWEQTQVLQAVADEEDVKPMDRGDAFGHSIVLEGDLAIIGAPGASTIHVFDFNSTNNGDVYMWQHSDSIQPGNWTTGGDPLFGYDLDLLRDDYGDFLFVGAPNNNPMHRGAAHMFRREPKEAKGGLAGEYKTMAREFWMAGIEGWQLTFWSARFSDYENLLSDNCPDCYFNDEIDENDLLEGSGSRFGASVAFSPRTETKDKETDFLGVVGNPYAPGGKNEPRGSAYWFRMFRDGRESTLLRTTRIKPLHPNLEVDDPNDHVVVGPGYGSSIRYSTTSEWGEKILVGDPGSGTAYLFKSAPYSQRLWVESKVLLSDGETSEGGSFGAAVSISGPTMLVGSPKEGSLYAPEPLQLCWNRPW